MASTVVGLFDDREHANRAVQDLMSAGFTRDQISVVANDASGELQKHRVDEDGNLAGEGAATGLTSGAVVGGLLGLLIGAGAIFLPIGVVAAGPIAGLIAGATAGAATGGILGGLIGLGIPEEHADVYAEGVRRGGTLVTVSSSDADAMRAHQILDRDGAVDIEDRGNAYREQGFTKYDNKSKPYQAHEIEAERARYVATPTTTTTQAAATPVTPVTPVQPTAPVTPAQPTTNLNAGEKLEVVREDIAVGKREVERGGARIRTYVTERPVTEQVTLREEHVNVQRTPVDRPVDGTTLNAFKEGTIEVRETAEVPVVAKEAHVVEEVTIGKTSEQRTETITDTVRETHVDVDQIPGTTTGTTVAGGSGTAYADNPNLGNNQPGIQTGGRNADGTPDTRGVTEKVADAITGDKTDDKTGKRV